MAHIKAVREARRSSVRGKRAGVVPLPIAVQLEVAAIARSTAQSWKDASDTDSRVRRATYSETSLSFAALDVCDLAAHGNTNTNCMTTPSNCTPLRRQVRSLPVLFEGKVEAEACGWSSSGASSSDNDDSVFSDASTAFSDASTAFSDASSVCSLSSNDGDDDGSEAHAAMPATRQQQRRRRRRDAVPDVSAYIDSLLMPFPSASPSPATATTPTSQAPGRKERRGAIPDLAAYMESLSLPLPLPGAHTSSARAAAAAAAVCEECEDCEDHSSLARTGSAFASNSATAASASPPTPSKRRRESRKSLRERPKSLRRNAVSDLGAHIKQLVDALGGNASSTAAATAAGGAGTAGNLAEMVAAAVDGLVVAPARQRQRRGGVHDVGALLASLTHHREGRRVSFTRGRRDAVQLSHSTRFAIIGACGELAMAGGAQQFLMSN